MAVHNACTLKVGLADKSDQLLDRVFFVRNPVMDVGSVKAADEQLGGLQLQALQDVGTGQAVRRGRQRHARDAWKAHSKHMQGTVLRPEIMAPLTHAMGLINRKKAQSALSVQGFQHIPSLRHLDPG
jgi:hypothetical protein